MIKKLKGAKIASLVRAKAAKNTGKTELLAREILADIYDVTGKQFSPNFIKNLENNDSQISFDSAVVGFFWFEAQNKCPFLRGTNLLRQQKKYIANHNTSVHQHQIQMYRLWCSYSHYKQEAIKRTYMLKLRK